MDIGLRIKKRREELGMSQGELAKKVGYTSRTTVNKIENGANNLRQGKIADFAKALSVTPAYLMGWEEDDLRLQVRNILAHSSNEEIAQFDRILAYLEKLNDAGIVKLVERAEELSEMKKYLKEEGDN